MGPSTPKSHTPPHELTPNTLVRELERKLAEARAQVGLHPQQKGLPAQSFTSKEVDELLDDPFAEEIDGFDLQYSAPEIWDPFTPSPSPHRPSSPLPPPQSPYERNCHKCGAYGDGHRDDDQDQVQCERCEKWSHRKCLDPNVDWDDASITFVCIGCEIAHVDPLQPE